jgi:type I restriction enzyme R subunit
MAKEATSRLKINKLLEESGWTLVDTAESKANVIVEPLVKQADTNDTGFIDYLLLDKKGFPLVVIEAKREERSRTELTRSGANKEQKKWFNNYTLYLKIF